MPQSSLALGRIAGTPIRVHNTWLFAFAVVFWSTAHGWFPARAPGLDSTTYAVMGVCAAVLLFVSVLAHELSHTFTARARGQQVPGITLFVFGGFSEFGEARAPADEFLISIAGPLASFTLAGTLWLVGQQLAAPGPAVGEVVTYLSAINLLLGAFNLLPGPPLDGGRVVRSLAWGATGSQIRATRVGVTVGNVAAAALVGLGVSQLLVGQMLAGLWIALVGWFLALVTLRSQQRQTDGDELRGMRVGDLMDARPAFADPGLSVEEFVIDHALRGGRTELVVLRDGRLEGIVTVADARAVPQDRWPATPVAGIMRRTAIPSLSPDAHVSDVLRVLAAARFAQVPVVRDGWVVGMFGRADVARFRLLRASLQLQQQHWGGDGAYGATRDDTHPASAVARHGRR